MHKHWQQVIQDSYQLDVELKPLDGEYDLNFRALGKAHQAGQQYLFKVMRADCQPDFVAMLCQAHEHIAAKQQDIAKLIPKIIADKLGNSYSLVHDSEGVARLIWMQSHIEGQMYANIRPHALPLISQLGVALAQLDRAMEDFQHPLLSAPIKWNLMQANWIEEHLCLIEDPQKQAIVSQIQGQFADLLPQLELLPQQAIHNDVNDYNLLVQTSLQAPAQLTGIIDFGDITQAPRICNLAICAAYVVLDHAQPEQALMSLIEAYHQHSPLTSQEADYLFDLLLMRLAVSVVNSRIMALENPDDPYITISEQPAWRFLLAHGQKRKAFQARCRLACGHGLNSESAEVLAYLQQNQGKFAHVLGQDLSAASQVPLCVADSNLPQNPFHMSAKEALVLGDLTDPNDISLGLYGEPRLVYTSADFYAGPAKHHNRRTVHLGVDIFTAAGCPVYSPLAATVVQVANHKAHLDYGGFVILRHTTPKASVFYTLYGHLNPLVAQQLTVGQIIEPGEAFAQLGEPSGNGGWDPHLHFQLILDQDIIGSNWAGVADPDDLLFWQALCPNPAPLLNLEAAHTAHQSLDETAVFDERQKHFGGNVKLTYSRPVMFLRGWQHHLFDQMGRPYLDAYNNVPHVGHAHPRIAKLAAEQLTRLNTNTRYLHPAQAQFAQRLLAKLPNSLQVCYFVNSGSEANELALRLARAHTGAKDMITPNHGYHGNTTGAIDLSAYKFNKPNGVGQQDWVHLIDVADDYNGRYKRDNPQCAQKYAQQVDQAIANIHANGTQLAGFIAETFPSVGGQIIPPAGYLAAVYDKVRAAGGICIADEVQTGLGRLGDYYFAFEHQKVTPDIVVLGKPIGNGHPIGVVITTQAIADSFANGIEYFSTFGGSTLSCRIGAEVLDIVEDEGLQANAQAMGKRLLAGLQQLQSQHPAIGDVRGMGLFIGVELVINQDSREPATALADYVLNRLREMRILIGTEGPADSILKIRPPLTITADDIDAILQAMDTCLQEAATC